MYVFGGCRDRLGDIMGKDVTAWASSQHGDLKVVPFHDTWIPPGNRLLKTPKTEAEKISLDLMSEVTNLLFHHKL